MGSHLTETVKACQKCYAEAEKLEKAFKAAKSPQEKEKLKKMAEAAKKMGKLYYGMIDGAKIKDVNYIDGVCDMITNSK